MCNVGEIRGFLHDFPKNLIFKTIQMQREGGGLVPKLSTVQIFVPNGESQLSVRILTTWLNYRLCFKKKDMDVL